MTVTLYKIIQSELIKKGLNEIVDNNGNLVFFNEDHQFMPKIFSYDQDISDIVDQLFTGVSLNFRENDIHFKKAFLYRFINRKINRQTIESFKLELMSTFLMNKDYINRIYFDLDKYLNQTKTNDQQNNETNTGTSLQNNTQTDQQTNTQNNTENNTQSTTGTSLQNNTQTNQQTVQQDNDGTTTSDNREAETTLPQNNIQIDVDSTVMTSANNNRISRNKQTNNQTSLDETNGTTTGETTGETTGGVTGETIASTIGEMNGERGSLTTGESTGETVGTSFVESKDFQLDELFKTNGLYEQLYNVFDKKCFMQIW